jgi:hypothetical protein
VLHDVLHPFRSTGRARRAKALGRG